MPLKDRITSSPEGLRAWHQERTIFETTNLICEMMDESGVSRSELARRLKVTKGAITQFLDGTANMTLRTVSDVFVALGYEIHPSAVPLSEPVGVDKIGSLHFHIDFGITEDVESAEDTDSAVHELFHTATAAP